MVVPPLRWRIGFHIESPSQNGRELFAPKQYRAEDQGCVLPEVHDVLVVHYSLQEHEPDLAFVYLEKDVVFIGEYKRVCAEVNDVVSNIL